MKRPITKLDANHTEIISALKGVYGVTVADTAGVGHGFPDIVVGYRGKNFLIEIKDGAKPPSDRKLTPSQSIFHGRWRGQVAVVTNVDEALTLVLWKLQPKHTWPTSAHNPPEEEAI